MNMTTCKSSWRTALGSAWLTLFVRPACAVVAVVTALGAAMSASAATNISWPAGNVGGSEANPWNIYDSSYWNGTTPSSSYHLNFDVSALTYLTNSAPSEKIADCIQPISGDFVFLGDIYCHVFGNLNYNTTGTKVSVVKKGNWTLEWALSLAQYDNTEISFTNETGSLAVWAEDNVDKSARIGDGANSKATIRSKDGNWNIYSGMRVGKGNGSFVSIVKDGGNWLVECKNSDDEKKHFDLGAGEDSTVSFVNDGGNLQVGSSSVAKEGKRELLIGRGKNSRVTVEKNAGDWTLYGTMRLAQGSGANAEFYHRGGSLTLKRGYGIQMGCDSSRCQSLFEISGGVVTNNVWSIGVPDAGKEGSASKFVVKGDGEYYSSEKAINLGYRSTGYLNIEDQGRVTVDHVTFCGDSGCESGEDCYLNLSGGTLAIKYIKYGSDSGSGSANATMTFNGGTLKARAAETLIQEHNKLTVTVGAGGGVIDNGDFDITIAENIDGTGGLIFTGGGTTTLSGAVNYSGKTAVTPGTTLAIANATAKSNILNNGLVLAGVPALNTAYTIFTYSSGGLTDDDLANVTCPIASALTKTTDGTSITITVTALKPGCWTGASGDNNLSTAGNWSDGNVPSDNASFALASAATLTKGASFAPSSITFAEGSAAVTIEGESGLADITAITNLSSVSHVINVPVVFADKIFVVQPAMSWEQRANPSIRFAGGVTGTTFADGTARYLNGYFTLSTGEGWVANTEGGNTRWGVPTESFLTLPSAMNTSELIIGEDSARGGAFTTGVMQTSARLLCFNYGEYVVTNELEVTLQNSVHYCGWDNISKGKFKFEKMTLKGANNLPFKFGTQNGSPSDSGDQYFYIGQGGLCFGSGVNRSLRYETGGGQNNMTVHLNPWHGDYTIHRKDAADDEHDFFVSTESYFGTTDENGNACTVTADAIFNGGSSVAMHIDGSGKFVVNAVNKCSCPVTVHDGATLAINAGKKLTTGAITLNAGTKLVLHDATLSNTLNLPTTGTVVTIRIDGDGTAFSSVDNEIAPVGAGTTANVVLDPASTALDGREASLEVEDGKLVLHFAHDYADVGNTGITSLTVGSDTRLVGVGGVKLSSLAFAETNKLTYDPIATPIKVSGTPTFAEGALIALSSDYAGMTCGRVVLMTYDGTATIPEGLFDTTSVASSAASSCVLTQEAAPDGENTQLVLTVGDYENDAKEIRIAPIGDSITEGYICGSQNDYPQYRTSVAARLAANGYKPVMKGIWHKSQDDAAGVQQPDEWRWHCGISGDRIITGGTQGGVRDNLHVYLDAAGNVDAITLLIGTNDIGAGNKTGEETYVAYTNLVFDIARLRPNTKIIGSTILNRTFNQDRVVAFNTLLKADYAAGRLPPNYSMLDLYEDVPCSVGDTYFDEVHPNWKGHAEIAKGFASGIMSALPLATYAGPIETEATNEPEAALGVAGIAATDTGLAAYTNGMSHIFTIETTASNNCLSGSSPYTDIVTPTSLDRPVKKAGYFMELVRKGTSHHRYVWVDFDATGKTLDEIDFPWAGANLDFVAEKMHVFSNDGSIHNVAANDDSVTGAIEGTHFNYEGNDDNANVPSDIEAGKFGWNDRLLSSEGYACFQAHRIFGEGEHWNRGEVLFAWNAWGSLATSANDEIGIGSFFYSSPLGNDGGNSMDYTFINRTTDGAADTLTAAGYQVMRLEIWAELDEARHGYWTGAANDGDLSNFANWEDGVVPSSGEIVNISCATNATLTKGSLFAPASITFLAGSAEVTINGESGFAGIAAITNHSSVSHVINVPVVFSDKIFVVQPAMSWEQRESPSIRFAGGVTGTTFAEGTARYLNGYFTLSTGEGWVANTQGSNNRWGLPTDSTLTTPGTTDTQELIIGEDSACGSAFTTGVMRTSARLLCFNYGEYVVTNELEFTLQNSVQHCGWDSISQGKFKFEKMTLKGANNLPFKFGTQNSGTSDTGHQYFYIGEGGLCFGSGVNESLRYETGGEAHNSTVHVNPWHGDYTINKKDNADDNHDFFLSTVSYFGTTDENGNACTVTADAIFNSGSDGAMHIDGSGKFVVNAVNKCSCAVAVHDSATLAINAGKQVTTGEITVESGATLEVGESGTVTLGGNLTLHDGAVLGFNWTERAAAPVLNRDGKNVTFGEGKTIKVKVSTADGITKPKSGANVLTSGGGFTGVNVSLADGSPDWALGVSVNDDGNIVLNVKPNGVVILFM